MDFLDDIYENVEQYNYDPHLLQCEACAEKRRVVENLQKELAFHERRVLQYTGERNFYIDLAANNWEKGDKLEHESAVNAAKLARIDETVQELFRQGFEYGVEEYALIGIWKEYDQVKRKLENKVKELCVKCSELADKSLLVSNNCDKLVAEINEQDEELKTAKANEKDSKSKISLLRRTFRSKVKKFKKDLLFKVKNRNRNVIESIVNKFEKEKLKSLDEDCDMDEEKTLTHASAQSEDNVKDSGMDEKDCPKHESDQLQKNSEEGDMDENESPSHASAQSEDNIEEGDTGEDKSPSHASVQSEDNIKESEMDENESPSHTSAQSEDNIEERDMDEDESPSHASAQSEDNIEEGDMDEDESPSHASAQSEDNIEEGDMDEDESPSHASAQSEDNIEEGDMDEDESPSHASAHSEDNIKDSGMDEKDCPKHVSDQLKDNIEDIDIEKNSRKLMSECLEDAIDGNDTGEKEICNHFVNRDLDSVNNSVNRHVTPVQSSQLLQSPVLQTNIDANDVAIHHNDIADADEDASCNLNLEKSDHSNYINLETPTDFSEDYKLHAGKSKVVNNVEVNDVQTGHSICDIEASCHSRSDDCCVALSSSNDIQSSVPGFVGKQSLEPLNKNQSLCWTDMDLGEDISGNNPEQATEDYSHSEEEEEAAYSQTYAQKNKWCIFSRTPVTPVSPDIGTVSPDITTPSEHVSSGFDMQNRLIKTNKNLERTTVNVNTQTHIEVKEQETSLDAYFFEHHNHFSPYPDNSGLSNQILSYLNNIASSCNLSYQEEYFISCSETGGTSKSHSYSNYNSDFLCDIPTDEASRDFPADKASRGLPADEASRDLPADEASHDLPADESNEKEECGSHSNPEDSRSTKSYGKRNVCHVVIGTRSRWQSVTVRHNNIPLALKKKLVKLIYSSASKTETHTNLIKDIVTHSHQIGFSETHIKQVIEAIEKFNRSKNTGNRLTYYATPVKKSCTECNYGIDKTVKNNEVRTFNNIQLSETHIELNEYIKRHVRKSRETLFADRSPKRRRLEISSCEEFPESSLTENSMPVVNGENNSAESIFTVVDEDSFDKNNFPSFVNNEASYNEEFIQNVAGPSGCGVGNSGNKKPKVTSTTCSSLSKMKTEHSAAEKITNSKTRKEMNTVSGPETNFDALEFSNSRVRQTQNECSQISHSTLQDEPELQIDDESDDDKSSSSFAKKIQTLDRHYALWKADKMRTSNTSVSKESNQDCPKLSSRKLLFSNISKRWMFSDEPELSENEHDISTGCKKEYCSNSSVNLNVMNDDSLSPESVLNISSKTKKTSYQDSQNTDQFENNAPKQKTLNEVSDVNKKVSRPFKSYTSSANRGVYNIDVSGLENTSDNLSLRTFDQGDQFCSIPTADTMRVIESGDDSVLCDDTVPETLEISQENKDVLRRCMEKYENNKQRKPSCYEYDFKILNDIYTMVAFLREIEIPFPNQLLFLSDLLKIDQEVLIAFTILRLENRYDWLTWSRLVELYAYHLSDQIQDILYNIQVILFYLRKDLPPDNIIINLTNFYVKLCLKIEDYSRIEKLAVDSFYSLKSKACIVVSEILKLYPLLLPPAAYFKKEKSLLIFVLLDTLFHANNRKGGHSAELLRILREKYSYKWGKQKNDEVATTLLSNLECNFLFHLEISIIIFSKKVSWHCSNYYLLQRGFYPIIHNWLRGTSELSEEAIALSVRCLAYVARGFPTNGREMLAERGIQTVSDKLMCLAEAKNMPEIVKKSLYFAIVCHGHEDFENMLTTIFKLDLRDIGEELLSRFLYYRQRGFWCENFSFLNN